MKSQNKHHLLLIEWEDSLQPSASWQFLKEAPELTAANCSSVGWLVSENKRVIMIAQNIADLGSEQAQGGGFMRIPKSCITKRKRLL